MEVPLDLAVIGGGAAGFFGALAMAGQRPGSRIAIFERSPRFLNKVRISGGGRCNVTHACFEPQRLVEYYPRGSKALLGPFHRFGPAEMIAWLAGHGVPTQTEPDGRIFPASNRSESIIDCFLAQARKLDIHLQTRSGITAVRADGRVFMLEWAGGNHQTARRILLTTGGDRGGFQLAAALGHSIEQPVPSLFTFHMIDDRLTGLAGVSAADVELTLPVCGLRQRGPVLITHAGLSGPAVIRLSAWAARPLAQARYRADLRIQWLPGLDETGLAAVWSAQRTEHPNRLVALEDPLGRLPQRLWRRIVQAALPPGLRWGSISRKHLNQLNQELTAGAFQILGKSLHKDEFVTCGGVNLDEVHFKTMESRITPGLYLAGEVLDIDGLTGGFNFQNAWTTAWIAGSSIAASLDSGD